MIETDKTQRYSEIAERVAHLTDAIGLPLDSGIRETVVILHALGIHTTESCEGHLDHGMAASWVEIAAPAMRPREKEVHVLQQRADLARAQGLTSDEYQQLADAAQQARLQVRAIHLKQCHRLMDYLAQFYRQSPMDYDRHLILNFADWLDKGRLQSQGASFQEMRSPDERARMLVLYQQEMAAFTAFLKRVYFEGEQ